MLSPEQLERLAVALRQSFDVTPDAEITVECAPGTLTPEVLGALLRCGVNRISLGVQSFVDEEARSVGRLHTRDIVFSDIVRLREAGITNINVDLIAGLPHQDAESWARSLDEVISAAVPHVSVYMLEVDEDSRLGRELIAGGARYHAHFVPQEDVTADLYLSACRRLEESGLRQYEISNFARLGCESRHNLKYWTREPYLGFGVDAHSMLPADDPAEAVRFATPDALEPYLKAQPPARTPVAGIAALEEAFFLGLRLVRGVSMRDIVARHGDSALASYQDTLEELQSDGLLEREGEFVRLTPRGRLVSNEVFQRFLTPATSASS
jgi:oxygen-independent coproporphyrinogen-3 oxidase